MKPPRRSNYLHIELLNCFRMVSARLELYCHKEVRVKGSVVYTILHHADLHS